MSNVLNNAYLETDRENKSQIKTKAIIFSAKNEEPALVKQDSDYRDNKQFTHSS